ncbi:MAG: T9SS type A sorting domain-containing protein [Carboxylicivirga sp.]|jgi:ELWxxDGT repeat protein|nr:T9SS type A sorting domain-containing protein [Carboxylicivirga sp.]
MKTISTLVLLLCALFVNAQTYSFEKISSLENDGLSNPSNLTMFDGHIYFTASGMEEGSSDAAIILCELNEDRSHTRITTINKSNVENFEWSKIIIDNTLYFSKEGSNGQELFKMDHANTVSMVKDINTGDESSSPNSLVVYEGKLYFNASSATEDNALFCYDIASKSLSTVNIGCSNPTNLCVFNNKIYFAGTTAAEGTELWVYDTTNGANIVTNFIAGVGDFNPREFVEYNNVLYFTASTDNWTHELYKLNGSNVELATVINESKSGSIIKDKVVIDGKMYFSALEGFYEYLFEFDGTTATKLKVGSGPGNKEPYGYVGFDGAIFGGAKKGFEVELFYYKDGSSKYIDVDPTFQGFFPNSSNPKNFTLHNSKVYFTAEVEEDKNIFMLTKDSATPVEKIQTKSSFTISPNPATNYFTITSSDNQIEGEVQIFDLSGKLVLKQHVNAGNETINIDKLQSGLYIVSYRDGSQNFTQKIRVK